MNFKHIDYIHVIMYEDGDPLIAFVKKEDAEKYFNKRQEAHNDLWKIESIYLNETLTDEN